MNDVPLKLASKWWEITLYAPCTLVVLAVFDPAFRRLSTFAMLTILFCGPYGFVVWLKESSTFAMSETTPPLVFLAVFSLWLAAIGYVLQHPTMARSPGRLPEPPDEGVQGAAPPIALAPEPMPKPA